MPKYAKPGNTPGSSSPGAKLQPPVQFKDTPIKKVPTTGKGAKRPGK